MPKGNWKMTRTELATRELDKASRAYLAAQKPGNILKSLDALIHAVEAWLAARDADQVRTRSVPPPAVKPAKSAPVKLRKARKGRKGKVSNA